MNLHLPGDVREAMIRQAVEELPNECCGLLAGRGSIELSIPLVNELRSPTSYRADLSGLFEAHRRLRRDNLDLLAIYHSHPSSDAVPSRRDRAEWCHGNAAMIIISLKDEVPVVRAWQIDGDRVREMEIA
jgi:proteasome lid subunit RPN8/RPN11